MLGEGSWKFVQIRAIRLICVPSCHARHGYTDDTDLLNDSAPLEGHPGNQCKSAQSVQSVFQPSTRDMGTLMPLI